MGPSSSATVRVDLINDHQGRRQMTEITRKMLKKRELLVSFRITRLRSRICQQWWISRVHRRKVHWKVNVLTTVAYLANRSFDVQGHYIMSSSGWVGNARPATRYHCNVVVPSRLPLVAWLLAMLAIWLTVWRPYLQDSYQITTGKPVVFCLHILVLILSLFPPY